MSPFALGTPASTIVLKALLFGLAVSVCKVNGSPVPLSLSHVAALGNLPQVPGMLSLSSLGQSQTTWFGHTHQPDADQQFSIDGDDVELEIDDPTRTQQYEQYEVSQQQQNSGNTIRVRRNLQNQKVASPQIIDLAADGSGEKYKLDQRTINTQEKMQSIYSFEPSVPTNIQWACNHLFTPKLGASEYELQRMEKGCKEAVLSESYDGQGFQPKKGYNPGKGWSFSTAPNSENYFNENGDEGYLGNLAQGAAYNDRERVNTRYDQRCCEWQPVTVRQEGQPWARPWVQDDDRFKVGLGYSDSLDKQYAKMGVQKQHFECFVRFLPSSKDRMNKVMCAVPKSYIPQKRKAALLTLHPGDNLLLSQYAENNWFRDRLMRVIAPENRYIQATIYTETWIGSPMRYVDAHNHEEYENRNSVNPQNDATWKWNSQIGPRRTAVFQGKYYVSDAHIYPPPGPQVPTIALLETRFEYASKGPFKEPTKVTKRRREQEQLEKIGDPGTLKLRPYDTNTSDQKSEHFMEFICGQEYFIEWEYGWRQQEQENWLDASITSRFGSADRQPEGQRDWVQRFMGPYPGRSTNGPLVDEANSEWFGLASQGPRVIIDWAQGQKQSLDPNQGNQRLFRRNICGDRDCAGDRYNTANSLGDKALYNQYYQSELWYHENDWRNGRYYDPNANAAPRNQNGQSGSGFTTPNAAPPSGPQYGRSESIFQAIGYDVDSPSNYLRSKQSGRRESFVLDCYPGDYGENGAMRYGEFDFELLGEGAQYPDFAQDDIDESYK